MLLERPEVERALEAVFLREGLSVRRIPEKHGRQISIDAMHFEEKELKDQLIPVLRKHAFHNDAWLSWTNQLLSDCKAALQPLVSLSEREQAFLQNIFERGKIEAALITNDHKLIEKINTHPLLQWKAKLVLENR